MGLSKQLRRDLSVFLLCCLLVYGIGYGLTYLYVLRMNQFLFFSLGGALVFGVAMVFMRNSQIVYAIITVFSVFLAAFFGEIYSWHTFDHIHDEFPSGFVTYRSPLGYHPLPGAHQVVRKHRFSGKEVYKVTYHIDEHGLRQTNGNQAADAESLLFFGGSSMFGDGVKDNETLPAQVSELTDGKYHVANFGFSGYGLHQMVRSLELDLPREVVAGRKVKAVIYQAIEHHVMRLKGKVTWGHLSPKYVFDQEKPAFQGPIHARGSPIGFFKRSRLYRDFFLGSGISTMTKEDIEDYISLLKYARDLVTERYQAPFYVLLWRNPANPLMPYIEQRVADEGFLVIPVSEVLQVEVKPGEPEEAIGQRWRDTYTIPGDGHPTAYAYRLLAEALVAVIL